MRYIIEKGDKFLCLQDYIMDDEDIAYLKDKIYISEYDDCITDDSGDIEHYMNNQDDFFEYFKPLSS